MHSVSFISFTFFFFVHRCEALMRYSRRVQGTEKIARYECFLHDYVHPSEHAYCALCRCQHECQKERKIIHFPLLSLCRWDYFSILLCVYTLLVSFARWWPLYQLCRTNIKLCAHTHAFGPIWMTSRIAPVRATIMHTSKKRPCRRRRRWTSPLLSFVFVQILFLALGLWKHLTAASPATASPLGHQHSAEQPNDKRMR